MLILNIQYRPSCQYHIRNKLCTNPTQSYLDTSNLDQIQQIKLETYHYWLIWSYINEQHTTNHHCDYLSNIHRSSTTRNVSLRRNWLCQHVRLCRSAWENGCTHNSRQISDTHTDTPWAICTATRIMGYNARRTYYTYVPELYQSQPD